MAGSTQRSASPIAIRRTAPVPAVFDAQRRTTTTSTDCDTAEVSTNATLTDARIHLPLHVDQDGRSIVDRFRVASHDGPEPNSRHRERLAGASRPHQAGGTRVGPPADFPRGPSAVGYEERDPFTGEIVLSKVQFVVFRAGGDEPGGSTARSRVSARRVGSTLGRPVRSANFSPIMNRIDRSRGRSLDRPRPGRIRSEGAVDGPSVRFVCHLRARSGSKQLLAIVSNYRFRSTATGADGSTAGTGRDRFRDRWASVDPAGRKTVPSRRRPPTGSTRSRGPAPRSATGSSAGRTVRRRPSSSVRVALSTDPEPDL
jgi:hypothetical protein